MPFTLVSGSFCLHFSGSTSFFCFRSNHLPTKRRVATVKPNFDEELEVSLLCNVISLLCKVTSKKWFNIVRHIQRCPKIFDRKKRSKKNRTCRHGGATFVRKSNCYRHTRKQHPNENETPHLDGNDDLICNDSEKTPTQTIAFSRVENSVETQGDCVEPGEDRNNILWMKTPKRLSKLIVWTRMISKMILLSWIIYNKKDKSNSKKLTS